MKTSITIICADNDLVGICHVDADVSWLAMSARDSERMKDFVPRGCREIVLITDRSYFGWRPVQTPEEMRLTDAAPELLACLQEAERLYTSRGLMAGDSAYGAWINQTRAAIAQAKGEPDAKT